LAAAEIHFERLLERWPADAEVLNETGRLRYLQGDFTTAEETFRQATALAPNWADARSNLGQSLHVQGCFAEAVRQFEAALALDARNYDARFNLALSNASLGSIERTLELVRALLAEKPDDATCHVLLAETLLRAGRFRDGWHEYGWRMRVDEYLGQFRQYAEPAWRGEDIPGAVVLVWPEQGYGDMLQFMRLVRVAAGMHPRMRFVLETQPALGRLAGLTFDDCVNLRVVVTGAPLPGFDRQVSIMSLPGLLDVSLAFNPLEVPYLMADPAEQLGWARRIAAAAAGTLAVGLVWAGNRREQHSAAFQAVDWRRSAGAREMLALVDVPGCTFFNLQVGKRAGEMAAQGGQLVDFTPELEDFASSAALIAGLDLIVSIDTSVVHLAGGLGKPVWMLSRHDCCWRWGRRDPASAWYPTLRAFYQPTPGDWASVVMQAREALAVVARKHAASC
jgi:hypothetical protein